MNVYFIYDLTVPTPERRRYRAPALEKGLDVLELLADARELVDRAWWLALFPGVALFLALLGCNLVGEGIRDWLDPRRGR